MAQFLLGRIDPRKDLEAERWFADIAVGFEPDLDGFIDLPTQCPARSIDRGALAVGG